ncbi:unnamed protein product [Musa acuminata subsp. malaccensis]|uniref:(wild Malaysian banana) hypothetical protein n=1 Tax=Musa acuminata subsp. malaccensis TaxID=214687 RepID=A0A8D7AKQ8_MUSAM|nr:unnamed protein product [Musa acuminata subsp. malaccensis]
MYPNNLTSVSYGTPLRWERYKGRGIASDKVIPFSAFWLRSSVVSVLISLISDMWVINPL